ncbi:MAG: high-affinity nickel-transport family protein [Candidatus Methylomirabilia bacterium]
MGSFLSVIGLGFLLGIQHATDPDHVAAVATIVSRERHFRSGALIGAFWGLGHTVTLAGAGGAIIILDLTFPHAVSRSLELIVAVMLVGLGVLRLCSTFRGASHVHPSHLAVGHDHGHGSVFHSHAHVHLRVLHRHPHVHPPRRLLAALQAVGPAQAVRSMTVGGVQGLAGSAAVALLILSTIRDPDWALAYLGVFGVGTILGMMAITAALALPLTLGVRHFARLQQALAAGTGLLALTVGVFLIYESGIVEGLLVSPATP